MKVMFISYWGLEDPLCVSTVLPHLEILKLDERLDEIHLLSFERGGRRELRSPAGVVHHPVFQTAIPKGLHFFETYFRAVLILCFLQAKHGFGLIIGRSVFAGILGHFLYRLFGTPYIVESYEPHVDYMVDNGVWRAKGIKSRLCGWFDRCVRKTAFCLLPVSHNFEKRLIEDGVAPERIIVFPCTVDEETFRFSARARARVREELGIADETVVGIYAGKFGGIYLDQEFESMLEFLQKSGDKFFLILLTDPSSTLCQALRESSILEGRLWANFVDPHQVPDFLSASDFAIAAIRTTKTSRYCSAIKVGEYLMNGLPTIIPEGIGDDSALIERYKLGCVLAFNGQGWGPDQSLSQFQALVRSRIAGESHISSWGNSLRGRHLAVSIYDRVMTSLLIDRAGK